MKVRRTFGEVVQAFADFMLVLESADEATFETVKRFALGVLKGASFDQVSIFSKEENNDEA